MLYSDKQVFAPNQFYSELIDNLSGLKKSIPANDLYFLKNRIDVACISISNIKDLLLGRRSLSLIDLVKTQTSLSEIRECLVFIKRLQLADTTPIIQKVESLIFKIFSPASARIN